ncbi:GntR family transcriptional regulator [Nitratireductor sp. GISD-1A_MAKvit]|uniref:GntR family transcriptional regulator n=1 Tax=Nitratireductor sp. GISD-1A_MAKvit TaxID=3234198 RepID=UPI003467CFC1
MKLKSIDVRQTASATDLVFEALRKAIVEGELSEGEHLRQDHIARMFNTSRIPVREALQRLEQDGLVTTQRYKGTVVAALSASEISEIFDFRALLESEVIRLAVPRLTPLHLKTARTHLEAFSAETEPARLGEANRNFHYCLYETADRPYHLQIIRTSLDRVDRYLRAQLSLTGGQKRAHDEHLKIFKACEDGAADEASRLTRAHILDAGRSLLNFLEKRRG